MQRFRSKEWTACSATRHSRASPEWHGVHNAVVDERLGLHRNKRLKASLVDRIGQAVADGHAPTIGVLGRIVGLRFPMSTVCALLFRKRLQTDLGKQRLGAHSIVSRANQHDARRIGPEDRGSKPTAISGIE
jgi:hypothetical protein